MLKGESVMVAVTPMDGELCRSQMKRADPDHPVIADPRTPGLRYRGFPKFACGLTRGAKLTSEWDNEPGPFAADYWLEVPGGFARVGIVVNGRRKSFDLEALEPFIATIKADARST
jgi:hypothetical protein